ncbi:MAG: ABC transporter ATP-binding protein [Desulfobacteraceae bacterium]|nr:ABC transporter ATP-binding protein [Desulfobacteraceae bacterium]
MAKAKEGHVEIKNVVKIYDPLGANVLAVDNCSLEIKAGEFLAIVGPSGCGKTTMLNMLAGFDSVTEGEVCVDEACVASPTMRLTPGPDRMVVFQLGALFPWKTVLENVCFGPLMQGTMSKKEAIDKARDLLRVSGLQGFEDDYPMNISSGMQRRVEIVRALINEPKILLLDEPFRALDAMTKSVMHKYLLDLFDMIGKTIMFITHDLDEAIYLADRIFVMTTRPGRLKKWIDVDLPRPRDVQVKVSDRFMELKQQAIDAVHEEALKAFERGERELAT